FRSPGIVVVAPAVISGCRPRVVGPSVVNGLVIVRRRITVIRRATVIVGAVGIHITSAAYVIRALDISPASAVKVGTFHIATMPSGVDAYARAALPNSRENWMMQKQISTAWRTFTGRFTPASTITSGSQNQIWRTSM